MRSTTYRVLILGDFHFGESYGAGKRVLNDKGYHHSTEHLLPFIDAADTFVVNLETPLVDPEQHPSGLKGNKKYIHWADPVGTGSALAELGVEAVSLANNHTMDHGAEGLHSTFAALEHVGIPWFGAGHNLSEATEPYRLRVPQGSGGGDLLLHGSFQYSRSHDHNYGFYASADTPGCAPLSTSTVTSLEAFERRSDSFHVAFPHWGANYTWHTPGQYRLSQRMLDRGYDLILGHGSHTVQEVLRSQQRWTVFGIGNGNFQSRGRWTQFVEENGILPFSFWAMLEIAADQGQDRRLSLKLYPVYSDNSFTNFRPGPVSGDDFRHLVQTLEAKSPNAWRFSNASSSIGHDSLGHHIQLDLGEWLPETRPTRLKPLADTGDPGDLPLRTISGDVQDAIERLHKGGSFGPTLLAMAGEKHGATTEWISTNRAVISCRGRRFLVDGYIAHESVLGEQCCKDKGLTSEFLQESGISVPRGREVTSVDEAVAVATELGRPVVVKPVDGNKSRGVAVNLEDEESVRSAFVAAQKVSHRVLVQDFIDVDSEMRILASNDQSYAVNKRLLPHVIGDGASSIAQLIEDKNRQRQLNPSLHNRPLPTDELTVRYLAKSGRRLDDIPTEHEVVTVRDVGGLGAGGDTHQLFESTPARIKQTAADAVRAIPGLQWAGVDLVVEKETGDPYVIEINTRASYGAALTPTYGQPRDVASSLWDLRWSATTPDITSDPIVNKIRRPRSRPSLLKGITTERSVSLAQALFIHAANTGLTVKHHSDRLVTLTSENGGQQWMTSKGFTELDRSAVIQVLRRHDAVRRLLALANVRRAKGQKIVSSTELSAHLRDIKTDVTVVPVGTSWSSQKSFEIIADKASGRTINKDGPWIVQSRPAGIRLRVFADARQSWAISSSSGSKTLSQASVRSAGKLAVEAIRAVPELRWGVVDVIVRPRALASGNPYAVLVEGITITPTLDPSSVVVAGSITDFFDHILDGSR